MDEEYFSPSPTPKIQPAKPSGGPTSTGLTLLIPSLKNLKKFNPPTPNVVDASIQGEKKIARPVKLKPLKEVLTKLIAQIKKHAIFHFFIQSIEG